MKQTLLVLFSTVYPVVEKFLGFNSSNVCIRWKNELMNERDHNRNSIRNLCPDRFLVFLCRGQRGMFSGPKKASSMCQIRPPFQLSATYPVCQPIFKIPQKFKQVTHTTFPFPDPHLTKSTTITISVTIYHLPSIYQAPYYAPNIYILFKYL